MPLPILKSERVADSRASTVDGASFLSNPKKEQFWNASRLLAIKRFSPLRLSLKIRSSLWYSFDAAIAAHISRHQDRMGRSSLASHMSSIWDAEETCDAFLFKKDPILQEYRPCLSPVASLESEKKVTKRSFDKLDEVVYLNCYY